jgi:natural resistance-associated macrophage protein
MEADSQCDKPRDFARSTDQSESVMSEENIQFSWRKLMSFIGPGFLMSIAYLDPGNIAGDLTAGVQGGYSLIWTLMWATILGMFYQSLASRIGVVTQRNLARLSAQQFSKKTRIILWIMTELAIIGSDVQEVIGSATALKILFGLPIWVGSLITIVDSLLFLFIHYFGIRKLESFFAFLISVMAISFFINMFGAKPDGFQIARGALIPSVPDGASTAAMGLVGAVIMPHNLYLYSSLVLSRKINPRSKRQVKEAYFYNSIDSAVSLTMSFLISTSVIATFAVWSNKNPDAAKELDLESASIALGETFSSGAKYIWAIGLLAAG